MFERPVMRYFSLNKFEENKMLTQRNRFPILIEFRIELHFSPIDLAPTGISFDAK